MAIVLTGINQPIVATKLEDDIYYLLAEGGIVEAWVASYRVATCHFKNREIAECNCILKFLKKLSSGLRTCSRLDSLALLDSQRNAIEMPTGVEYDDLSGTPDQ